MVAEIRMSLVYVRPESLTSQESFNAAIIALKAMAGARIISVPFAEIQGAAGAPFEGEALSVLVRSFSRTGDRALLEAIAARLCWLSPTFKMEWAIENVESLREGPRLGDTGILQVFSMFISELLLDPLGPPWEFMGMKLRELTEEAARKQRLVIAWECDPVDPRNGAQVLAHLLRLEFVEL